MHNGHRFRLSGVPALHSLRHIDGTSAPVCLWLHTVSAARCGKISVHCDGSVRSPACNDTCASPRDKQEHAAHHIGMQYFKCAVAAAHGKCLCRHRSCNRQGLQQIPYGGQLRRGALRGLLHESASQGRGQEAQVGAKARSQAHMLPPRDEDLQTEHDLSRSHRMWDDCGAGIRCGAARHAEATGVAAFTKQRICAHYAARGASSRGSAEHLLRSGGAGQNWAQQDGSAFFAIEGK